MGESFKSKVIFVVGPTAVGKSSFAHKEAKKTGGCIVNADSLQFYTDLNIGTAKPTSEEMKQVPHQLFNIRALGDSITAGEYRHRAMEHLENSKHSLHFFVGGSGFYIQALEKGMFDIPDIPQKIKLQVEALKAKGELSQALKKEDPAAALKIKAADSYRQQRALEVSLATGVPFSEHQAEFKKKKFPYPLLKIGFRMERELLRQRVALRIDLMREQGLFEEVKGLLKHKKFKDWAPLKSVGYKETVWAIEEGWTDQHWKEELVKSTMRLAKKQMTWFKRDPEIQWLDVVNQQQAYEKASALVDSFTS